MADSCFFLLSLDFIRFILLLSLFLGSVPGFVKGAKEHGHVDHHEHFNAA
jgi:hypothetical protein